MEQTNAVERWHAPFVGGLRDDVYDRKYTFDSMLGRECKFGFAGWKAGRWGGGNRVGGVNKHRIILRGSVLGVISLGATTIVGFLLMPFVVHRLGDRMYGYWALAGAMLGYYGLLDLGFTSAVAFRVAKAIGAGDDESPSRILSTALVAFTVLGLGVLALTGTVAALCPLFITNPPDARIFRVVILIVGFGCACGLPGRAFMGGLYGHLRNDLISLASMAVLIARTALVIGVILLGWGIVGLATVSVLADAALFTACFAMLRRIQKGLRFSLHLTDKKTLKELFDYGKYSTLTRIGDQLRFAVDGWIVAAFLGVAVVAHYTIASRLAGYFMSFILNAVALLQSWFSQLLGNRDYDGIRRVLSLGTRVAAALSTIIAVSFALYGRTFIVQWMGARYADAYWPALILVSAMFCDMAQQSSVAYLFGVSRHRYLAFQTIAEGVANLGLSIYWGRTYGMIGVAMGTLVPMFVAKVVLQPAYVCRAAGVPLWKYYIQDLGTGIAAPALCCIGLWAFVFRRMEFSNLWMVCATVGAQGVVCAVAAFYFVLGSEDRRRLLAKIWPGRKMAGEAATSANAG